MSATPVTADSALTVCPQCGADVPSRYRFCGDCGAALGAPATPGIPAPPAPSPGSPAPRAWRDERRVVAILFADLVGFTTFCETRDPEEVTLFVSELFRDFTAVIERHGGYVDKYIGDGVLALYGAPVSHGDDAERAVRAGLALIEVLRSRPAESGPRLGIRVGVDLGEVVVGTLSTAGAGDYTVTGDAVNTAARLQGAADPDTVLVSEAVHRAIRGGVVSEPVPVLSLKGKRVPVHARVVRSIAAGAPERPRETPFAGRTEELATLLSWAEAARAGTPLAAVVRGEPGIGKSRLAHELRSALERAGWRALTARVEPFADAVFGPIRALVRQAELDGEEAAIAAETEGLLAPSGGPADAEHAAARDGRRRLELARLARALARERPLAVFVEDAHWADPDSLDLLTALAEGDGPLPLLLVLTARPPGDLKDPPPALRVERLDLAPLDPAAAREVVESLIDLSPADAARLVERSGGNPLFLEELVATLRERRRDVPESIHGLLVSRLDQLPPGPRASVRLGAVLGDRFPRAVLRDLYDRALARPGFEADVELLLERGVFVAPDDATLGFRHALTREVAYGTELHLERRRVHGWAADAIERTQPEDERTLPLLAHHRSESGDWERAFPLVLAAGREALAQYALADAERWLERAAEAVAGGLVAPEPAGLEALWTNLTEIRLHRSEAVAALEAADRLAAVAEEGGSAAAAARALLLRGRAYWRQDRLADAREAFERALGALPEGADRERAEIHNALGVAALRAEDPSHGEPYLREALATWERLGDRLGQAKAAVNIGNLVAAGGRLTEAEEWYQRAIALGREIPDRLVITNNLTNLGMIRLWQGRFGPARASFQESLEHAEDMGMTRHVWHISENLGRCHLAMGDLRAAARAFRRCEEGGAACENLQRAYSLVYLARTYLGAMDNARARDYLDHASTLAAAEDHPDLDAEILFDRARLAYLDGDLARARADFQRCWEKAPRDPYPWLIAALGYLWVLDARLTGTPPPEDAWAFEGPAPLRATLHYQAGRAALAAGARPEAFSHLSAAADLLDGMEEGLLARHAHYHASRAADEAERAAHHLARARALTRALAERLPDEVAPSAFAAHPINRRILDGPS